jgi:hypothetical protein
LSRIKFLKVALAPFKTLVKLDHPHFGGARREEYATPEVVSIRGEGR